MSSSERIVKHFVIVRFFPYKDADFEQDIFDLNFVSRQVLLAKNNCLKSLENQSNKNFELIFLANEKYFTDKKFDFLFTELRNSTTLPINFIKTAEKNFAKSKLTDLIKKAYNEYEFVIQSRIDLDDFVYKDGVADTQNKIYKCDNMLLYGYLRGYVYFNGEMYPYYQPWGGLGHKSIFQSLILKSSFAKKLPFFVLYSVNHTKFKPGIERILTSKGLTFSENMFQQNNSTKAFIWFRHDANYSNMGNPLVQVPKYIQRVKKLTGEEVTKKYFETEFGFHYEIKSIT